MGRHSADFALLDIALDGRVRLAGKPENAVGISGRKGDSYDQRIIACLTMTVGG
jgi:hypothetical protein